MKRKTTFSSVKNPVVVFTLFFSIVISSCSNKVRFVTSAVVPAAEGYVKIKKDDNSNYSIELNVINLASPDRLTPARDAYVVWMDSKNEITRNIGQLKSTKKLFSSALESSLNTVTPFKPVRIFITAEDDVKVEVPGKQVVLSTKKF